MTRAEMRATADAGVLTGSVPMGDTWIVDHNDGAVLRVTVWANKREVWFDEFWSRDHADWPKQYQDACLRLSTLHIKRR